MSSDRRRFTRFSTSVPAGIRFPKGDVKEGWGRIIDISAGGLRIESQFELKVGGIIYVSFILKDGVQFSNLRSRIVRLAYEEGYFLGGLEFDDVVDQQTLKEVINALANAGGLVALKE